MDKRIMEMLQEDKDRITALEMRIIRLETNMDNIADWFDGLKRAFKVQDSISTESVIKDKDSVSEQGRKQ